MSTRGFIAFGTPEQWMGVYNHHDSRPESLGPRLWSRLRGDLHEVRVQLFRAGRGADFFADTVAAEPALSSVAHPLMIEWVYVVDPETRRLHVLGSGLRGGEWEHFEVGAFDLDGLEPSWHQCTRARDRANAPEMLEDIRKRFGEDAYRRARLEMLGDN